MISNAHMIVLRHIGEMGTDPATGRHRAVDIRKVSEPYRQKVIDLGMEEPPLVSISGDWLFVTIAGRELLANS